jgi:bZIP transcription factor.
MNAVCAQNMRPTVPDELVEQLNEQTTDQFRAPASRLQFKDRLQALLDKVDALEQQNKNLRERLQSDTRVIQSGRSDDRDDDRRGDTPSSLL